MVEDEPLDVEAPTLTDLGKAKAVSELENIFLGLSVLRRLTDYEDRLALYSQIIWTCQCTGKSSLTHQEAWTSEAKVRVLLSSSFPTPLLPPILRTLHHSTLPLDQLVEAASGLCYSRFHPGEELTLLGPQPMQVRVIRSKEDSGCAGKKVNISNGKEPSTSPTTPIINGCSPPTREIPMVNGTSNGVAGINDSSPTNMRRCKEDSPGRKKSMLLPLLYDVSVIGEEKIMTEVPAKFLQRTYKIPPKEHFRLFVRANALRQRSSAYTPWIVSEDLVKQYNIPNKLASIFTNPRTNSVGRKRKAEGVFVERAKKVKAEKTVETVKRNKADPASKPLKPGRKPRVKRDPNTPRKKPGPKPGFKRTPKLNPKSELPKPSLKLQTQVKMETSDSDDDVSLAVLANRSPKIENGAHLAAKPLKMVTPPGITPLVLKKRVTEKDGKELLRSTKRLKQTTLFDMRSPKKMTDGTPKPKISPRKSPQKRQPNPEAVLRTPVMKKMVHQYNTLKGVKGTGRKLVHTMDQVLKKLSLAQIEVIPEANLRADIMKRHERMLEKRIVAKMTPKEREDYSKQKARAEAQKRRQTKQERNRKMEEKILTNLKPLPQPQLVPTPEEIPNSLFGDVAMVVEFIECYHEIVKTDKKTSISCSQLMQALAAGPKGLKYVAEVMCLILHLIIDDTRIGCTKELGVKISDLPVHYQTAIEVARLCLRKHDSCESASQHSDENTDEGEEQNELSDGLIHKLESSELYELQPPEVLAVLKALCHQAIASDTSLEHIEDIEEKAYILYKERAQVKKMSLKEEMEKKQEKKKERLQKKMDKTNAPKKSPGRPKGYSPKKKAITIDNFYSKKEGENLDLASRVKRKRLSPEEIIEEKEKTRNFLREQKIKEDEEKRRVYVVQECEKVLMQKDLLIRLQPLGVDRNHDRYWLFNNTTPGLYVEKGWVDPNTTYNIQSSSPSKQLKKSTPARNGTQDSGSDSDDKPLAAIKEELTTGSPTKSLSPHKHQATPVSGKSAHNGTQDSGSDSDDKPLATIKEELTTGSPKKQEKIPGRRRPPTVDENTQTFPPVGQNMWFYYKSIGEVDELLKSLAEKGIRESKLKLNLSQVRAQLEANLTTEWTPIEDLEDGAQQLIESLREDIIQIERELKEGWLGAVPNPEEWEKKALEATTLQELGECLLEAQKYMHFKYLKGIMQPSKKLLPSESLDAPPEYEEFDSPAVHHWRDAVVNCQTFSRMHMLVGMFDSCIKWEKSIATKNDDGDSGEKEKICRVCERGLGLIFCCKCPAAYHSECHDPPLQTRARKDWACVNCSNTRKKKNARNYNARVHHEELSEQEMILEAFRATETIFEGFQELAEYSESDQQEEL
ncbi:tyrosine-protein kinase BAZ1B-like [Homarus americanus]|uniref:tyrosine-protein kinase BAZ1B-like n=1 Tax=Homarus americanus TaxID=6706 RepID=UPI001C493A7D|nr:tyrosine-protein kinase BAZ1B-like [Homarus americanus]